MDACEDREREERGGELHERPGHRPTVYCDVLGAVTPG
jgi:hypothetical protein